MGEFFKGWKRKIGVVTLMIACVFVAGWVRSYTVSDRIISEEAGFIVESVLGRIEWGRFYAEGPKELIEWRTADVRQIPPEYHGPEYRNENQERSYWSIVLPLTFLSAYLLLSRPRRSKPPAESS